MRSLFILLTFILLSNSNLTAQITKGNWLVGGTGSYRSYVQKTTTPAYWVNHKFFNLNLSPSAGYFFTDKFAAGLEPTFTWYKGGGTSNSGGASGGSTNSKWYGIGPFVRYYFLGTEMDLNVLIHTNYQRGINDLNPDHGTFSRFSAMAGPVYYFNSAVGIEILVGYFNSTENFSDTWHNTMSGIQVTAGFRIHLIK